MIQIYSLPPPAKSFIGLVKMLYNLPEVKNENLTFLSNNICQDPLENFFGCQRQRGGTSDNPNVQSPCNKNMYYKVSLTCFNFPRSMRSVQPSELSCMFLLPVQIIHVQIIITLLVHHNDYSSITRFFLKIFKT